MKKLLALAVMFLAVSSYAGIDYGLDAGSTRLGVFGGMSSPVKDWDFGGQSGTPGQAGGTFGVEFIRNMTPMMAVGFELGYTKYGDKAFNGFDVNSKVFGGSVLGRINFLPSTPTRIYIPFGAGINYFNAEDSAGNSGTSTAPSLTAGVGIEFDLSPEFTLGVEGRYTELFLSQSEFHGNNKFSAIDAVVKLGVRF